jgi:hypothetical protein
VNLRSGLGRLGLAAGLVTGCVAPLPQVQATGTPRTSSSPASSAPSRASIATPNSGPALRGFPSRMGAVDPLAARALPSDQSFAGVRLAAGAGTVTIQFANRAPQSITVIDDMTGSDLYHVSSRFGPGNPQVDQGFVQVFLAPLHADDSQQLILAYGECQPTCTGASQVLVVSMNAEHHVVTEQLRVDSLTTAVAEARADGLWITEWNGASLASARHYRWVATTQSFAED